MTVEVVEVEPKVFLQDKRRKNWFWDHNEIFESDLSANAKLVRLFLARCANGERTAWPSLSTIARRCGISKPTVIKAMKELEEKNWLKKRVRKRPSQEFDATLYMLEEPPITSPSSASSSTGSSSEGGSKGDLPPVKNITRGVVNEVDNLVNDVDNVVNDVDPNNTHGTIQYNHNCYISSEKKTLSDKRYVSGEKTRTGDGLVDHLDTLEDTDHLGTLEDIRGEEGKGGLAPAPKPEADATGELRGGEESGKESSKAIRERLDILGIMYDKEIERYMDALWPACGGKSGNNSSPVLNSVARADPDPRWLAGEKEQAGGAADNGGYVQRKGTGDNQIPVPFMNLPSMV